MKYHFLYFCKSNEDEVKHWFKKKNWNRENEKFNEKWNNISVVIRFKKK